MQLIRRILPVSECFYGILSRCGSIIGTVGILWLCSTVQDPRVSAAEIRVTQGAPRHPILIRNEHGPLLRVVIDVPSNSAGDSALVRIQQLNFALTGTDHVDDIESLSVFSTGDQEVFSAKTSPGPAVTAAETISVPVDYPAAPGKHVLWLSCRLKPTADLTGTITVRCTQVIANDKTLIPNDAAGSFSHRVGVALRRHNDDGVHTSRIPALTTTKTGTLLCVYDLRRRMGRDLQEDIDIGLSRSTDQGQSWEPVRVIMDMGEYAGLPQEQNGCSDPGIIVDHVTGEIFCFALWMNGKPGHHQWVEDGSEPGFDIGNTAQFMMVKSTDDGISWSKPENLTRLLKQESWWLLAPSPQSGIQLTDGTLVMPVQGRTAREAIATFATIMISRDHGTTWQVRKAAYTGGNECQAVVLSDGTIMLNIRNDRERFRAVAVTKDLGETWEQHPTSRNTLIEPNCNGSLLRFDLRQEDKKQSNGQSGHVLLFANPHTRKGRTHHTLQVSFDEGMSWPESHHLLLDEGQGAGYPSLTQVDAESVGIVYEGSQAQLVYERIPIRELLQPRKQYP